MLISEVWVQQFGELLIILIQHLEKWNQHFLVGDQIQNNLHQVSERIEFHHFHELDEILFDLLYSQLRQKELHFFSAGIGWNFVTWAFRNSYMIQHCTQEHMHPPNQTTNFFLFLMKIPAKKKKLISKHTNQLWKTLPFG